MTQVLVTFGPARALEAKVGVDLTPLLGSTAEYAKLINSPGPEQAREVAVQAGRFLKNIEFTVDGTPVALVLASWKLPDISPDRIGDNTVAAMTTLYFRGTIRSQRRRLPSPRR